MAGRFVEHYHLRNFNQNSPTVRSCSTETNAWLPCGSVFAAGTLIIAETVYSSHWVSKDHRDSFVPLSLHHDPGNLLNSKGISLWGVYFKHSSIQPLLDKYFGKASIVQIE